MGVSSGASARESGIPTRSERRRREGKILQQQQGIGMAH
jgi:hypothetical protein